MTSRIQITRKITLVVQALFVAALAIACLLLPPNLRARIYAEVQGRRPQTDVVVENIQPAVVVPLYDDVSVVADDELGAVLAKVLPRFSSSRLRPNHVEHALRIWRADIEFTNPDLISGPRMVDYLLDSAAYVDSWGTDASPILEPNGEGIHIRWGPDASASVHHDHLLACLAEAGVSLDRPVYLPARQAALQQIFTEALGDFRIDEKETEWSAMAFSFYLAPQQTSAWHNADGRRISFDMLATRLMRGSRGRGVCLGTHRVYSVMALLRLNDDFGGALLSQERQHAMMDFLRATRDLIVASQDVDGSWPPNWHEGASAAANKDPDEKLYRRVIATGHHLEWLAIAPKELHPPHEQIVKAADWVIDNTLSTPQDVIDSNYTYYSHVGNALALWRGTSVPEFWQEWRTKHPDAENLQAEITGKDQENP